MATAEAIAQAWAGNRVPAEFATRTLDEARKTLIDNGETTAANIVTAIGAVVERHERDGMEEPLSVLRDERQQLEDRRQRARRGE